MSRAAPLEAGERIVTLDVLRGLALFGMILVHFHQRMRLEAGGLEDLIGWGVWVLVEQKAWGTFAFLFGVGFAVLLRRLEARGQPVVPIYLRRLAALALFGIVAQVGFGFHILFTYAWWGLALLLVRHWPSRALLGVALASVVAGPLVTALRAWHAWWLGVEPPGFPAAALWRAAGAAGAQGDYGALLAARWSLFTGTLPHDWHALVPDVNLALFVLGLLAVRHRVLDEPTRHVRLIVGWMAFGFAAWAAWWLALRNLPSGAVPGTDWPRQSLLGLVQDQWLCFTYIGAVVLLLAFRPRWTARLRMFADTGRMALTNYMLQAMTLDVLSSGYGLGLRLRPYAYVPAALALFAVQLAVTRAWMARFRFGPLEWLWRLATYLRPQPLRRDPVALRHPEAA